MLFVNFRLEQPTVPMPRLPLRSSVHCVMVTPDTRFLMLVQLVIDRPWRRLLVDTMLPITTSDDLPPMHTPSPVHLDTRRSRTVTRVLPRIWIPWPHSCVLV